MRHQYSETVRRAALTILSGQALDPELRHRIFLTLAALTPDAPKPVEATPGRDPPSWVTAIAQEVVDATLQDERRYAQGHYVEANRKRIRFLQEALVSWGQQYMADSAQALDVVRTPLLLQAELNLRRSLEESLSALDLLDPMSDLDPRFPQRIAKTVAFFFALDVRRRLSGVDHRQPIPLPSQAIEARAVQSVFEHMETVGRFDGFLSIQPQPVETP